MGPTLQTLPRIHDLPAILIYIKKTLQDVLHDKFFYVFFSLVSVYGISVALFASHHDAYFTASKAAYTETTRISLVAFFWAFFVWRLIVIMFVTRPNSLGRAILADIREYVFNFRRIAFAIPVLVLLPMFLSFFTSAKNLIPQIVPFYLDPGLAEFEQWLHLGKQPWEWLHPVFGFAMASSALSFTYKTWFIAKLAVCFWLAFSLKRTELRAQFFVSFVLCWIILGTIMAMLLSSAGPAYFANVYPDLANPYAGLVSYLREADRIYPVYDLFAIDYLWENYSMRESRLFSGISAMPSMHVSLACIFALFGWRISRALGIVFSVYLLLILIGSVHLSWHYAADGYVSVVVTCLIWWMVGKIFPEKRPGKSDGDLSRRNPV